MKLQSRYKIIYINNKLQDILQNIIKSKKYIIVVLANQIA